MDTQSVQPNGNDDEELGPPLDDDELDDPEAEPAGDAPGDDRDPDSDPELDEDDLELAEDDYDEDDTDGEGELDDDDDQEQALGGGTVAAAPPADLEGLVHFVVSRLVADPESIEISSEQRGGTMYIALRVPESDLGRVIGREGRTAKAIRTLVSIAGSKSNVHVRLDIDG